MEPFPDNKIHVANMGHTWVLSAPGGPHVGPMNLAIRVGNMSMKSVIICSVDDWFVASVITGTNANDWFVTSVIT